MEVGHYWDKVNHNITVGTNSYETVKNFIFQAIYDESKFYSQEIIQTQSRKLML